MKILSKLLIATLLIPLTAQITVHANEPPEPKNGYLTGSEGRVAYGSGYWSTSNLREWLNSDKDKVDYTSNPPSYEYMGTSQYATEAGFLKEFTSTEKDAIAVTQRRELLSSMDQGAREGGSGSTGHANIYSPVYLANYGWFVYSYMGYSYKKTNDKVYLLTPAEAYWYLNRRGFDYKRDLTPQASKKHNVSTIDAWWLQGNTQWSLYDMPYFANNGNSNKNLVSYNHAYAKYGIVPVVNIKPNYVFSNNKTAKSLKIGEKITFGRYMGAPIEWQVINKSDSGHPMLLASKVLDLKAYDAKGDQSKMHSEYINFPSHELSLFDDLHYKSSKESSDVDIPTVILHNKDELGIRQNNSFTLDIEVKDPSGIEYVIKPDGTKTTETRFKYTFDKNGQFVLKIMDNAGNYNEYLIPVSNVNIEPYVNAQASTDNWTNKDVSIAIQASNNVNWAAKSLILKERQESGSSWFPNYSSYVGKKFRVSGSIKLLHYDERSINSSNSVGFSYRSRGETAHTYTLAGNWHAVKSFNTRDMIDKGYIPFDFEWTVPSNYSEGLSAWLKPGSETIHKDSLRIEFKDLKYQLLDDSDFGITSITLPNGKVINATEYTDTISKEGYNSYRYSILDNRGKVTTKSVIVKIDKTKPDATFSYNKEKYKKTVDITVSGTDALSGVKRIKLPNGTYVNGSTAKYTASKSGKYDFEIEDVAGNTIIKSVTIDNVDSTPPSGVITGASDSWTSSKTLSISATDSESGVKEITLPNGRKVSGSSATYTTAQNGVHSFIITDNVGNSKTQDIMVSKVDNSVNAVNSIKTNMTHISEKDSNRRLTINIDPVKDTQSGLKGYSYVLDRTYNTQPDNIVDTTSTTITRDVRDTGKYYLHIKAIDNINNSSETKHFEVDVPLLTSKLNQDSSLNLLWNMNSSNQPYLYSVMKKRDDESKYSALGGDKLRERVNVLNIHPNAGEDITYRTWDGENIADKKSSSLKQWMEMPNGENPKGYGMGIIEVIPLSIDSFNANPDTYLYKSTSGANKDKYVTNVRGFEEAIDVIMFGTWDSNGAKDLNTQSASTVKEYLDNNGSALFGHDTIHIGKTFDMFSEYADAYSRYDIPFVRSSVIKTSKDGLITQHPWGIGETNLNIPSSHTSYQMTNDKNTWMVFTEHNNAALMRDGGYSNDSYLSINKNVGLIQTGHSSGAATSDEQKVLANTLFYMSQLTTITEKHTTDRLAIDVNKPSVPVIESHQFMDSSSRIRFNYKQSVDVGTEYSYYIQATGQDDNTNMLSNTLTHRSTSGLKGYSYTVDKSPNTVPDDTVDTTDNNIIIDNNKGTNIYLHVKAIDNAGNSSETSHYHVSDTVKPTLRITGNPSSWTNKDVTLRIEAIDNESGLREIILPNGSKSTTSPVNYNIGVNGTYTVKAVDNFGNETSENVIVSKIDKEPPTASIAVPTTTTTKTIAINLSNIRDNLSGASLVEISESKDFTQNTKSVSITGQSSKVVNYELSTLASLESNYLERGIYIRIRDVAGNIRVYSYKTTLLAPLPDLKIIQPIKDNELFVSKESVQIKWEMDTKGLPIKELKFDIKDLSNNVITSEVIDSSSRSKALSLPSGTFEISLTATNMSNLKVTVKTTIRINIFKDKGNVITKDINPGKVLSKVAIKTDALLPKGTNIVGRIYYKVLESGEFNKDVYLNFAITGSMSEVDILVLPEKSSKVRVEYTLQSKDNISTPALDNIIVYGR